MKKIHWATFLRWFGMFLAIGLLIWLFVSEGWGNILKAFRQVAVWRVALVVFFTILSRFAVAGRWYVLLRGAAVKTSYAQILRITFAGLFASNFLPTTIGGDIVRLGGGIRMGYDRAIVLASLVVDRLVGMTGMALATPLALVSLPASAFSLGKPGWLGGFLAAGAWREHPWYLRIKAALRRLWEALLLWLRHPVSLGLALFFTMIHMLCTFGSVTLLLRGMNQPASFWLLGGLWAIGYFITLLPVSVNGMGTQELAITLLYTRFAGVSMDSALVLALMMRAMPMLVSLPGAWFVPGMIAGNEKRGKMDQENIKQKR